MRLVEKRNRLECEHSERNVVCYLVISGSRRISMTTNERMNDEHNLYARITIN